MTPFHFRFESELYLPLTFYKYYIIFFIKVKNRRFSWLKSEKYRHFRSWKRRYHAVFIFHNLIASGWRIITQRRS